MFLSLLGYVFLETSIVKHEFFEQLGLSEASTWSIFVANKVVTPFLQLRIFPRQK